MFSVATNVADIASLKVALGSAETNLALSTCIALDITGDPNTDCCISGSRFICAPRSTATSLGINTGMSCQECPPGVIT